MRKINTAKFIDHFILISACSNHINLIVNFTLVPLSIVLNGQFPNRLSHLVVNCPISQTIKFKFYTDSI